MSRKVIATTAAVTAAIKVPPSTIHSERRPPRQRCTVAMPLDGTRPPQKRVSVGMTPPPPRPISLGLRCCGPTAGLRLTCARSERREWGEQDRRGVAGSIFSGGQSTSLSWYSREVRAARTPPTPKQRWCHGPGQRHRPPLPTGAPPLKAHREPGAAAAHRLGKAAAALKTVCPCRSRRRGHAPAPTSVERETGVEPATFSLARRRSTTEPLPQTIRG